MSCSIEVEIDAADEFIKVYFDVWHIDAAKIAKIELKVRWFELHFPLILWESSIDLKRSNEVSLLLWQVKLSFAWEMLGEVKVAHIDEATCCRVSPLAEEHRPDALFTYSSLGQPYLSLKEHYLLRKIVFQRNGSGDMALAFISESNEVKPIVNILLRWSLNLRLEQEPNSEVDEVQGDLAD